MKYRKKPVVVEAYQITRGMIESVLFDGGNLPDGLRSGSASYNPRDRRVWNWFGIVTTIHGQETSVIEGDWVITEPDGIHHYPCKPDIFAQTYEAV
jgi:hypothetical protein